MTEGLKWTVNEVPKSDDKHLELMSEAFIPCEIFRSKKYFL